MVILVQAYCDMLLVLARLFQLIEDHFNFLVCNVMGDLRQWRLLRLENLVRSYLNLSLI